MKVAKNKDRNSIENSDSDPGDKIIVWRVESLWVGR